MKAPVLQLVDVTRRFPGVLALDDVSFDVLPGEVHALVGENGAGKSTLINLVSGVLQPDSGHLQFAGTRVNVADPVAARRLGIATVHQEADFFPTLSVAENMALLQGLPVNRLGLIRWDDVHAQARRAVDAIDEPIDVGQPASQLSIAHRHMGRPAAGPSGHPGRADQRTDGGRGGVVVCTNRSHERKQCRHSNSMVQNRASRAVLPPTVCWPGDWRNEGSVSCSSFIVVGTSITGSGDSYDRD